MNEAEQKKQIIETERINNKKQLEILQEQIKSIAGDEEKVSSLQLKLKELELKKSELDKKHDELRVEEKKTPWNVDTISKPAFSKTIINKTVKPSYDDLTEEEKEVKMRDFVKDNKKILEEFGMLRRYNDSKNFLLKHSHLACESTANYLVIYCINLQMEEKSKTQSKPPSFGQVVASVINTFVYFLAKLMEHVAHQCICMQYILELVSESKFCSVKNHYHWFVFPFKAKFTWTLGNNS